MDYEPPKGCGVNLCVHISSDLNARLGAAYKKSANAVSASAWIIAALETAVDRCLHPEIEQPENTPTIPVTENNMIDLYWRMTKVEHAVNQIADKCSSIEARAKVSRTNTFKIANEVSKITEGK